MNTLRILRTKDFIDYPDAVTFMEGYVDEILYKNAPGCLWFLEHPPTITGGTSSDPSDILNITNIPVYTSGRGGKYTYHGPGQRVIYIMLDLKLFTKDVRSFVNLLERWLINSFSVINLTTEIKKNLVGVWVPQSYNNVPSKIAAIGLRIKKWVTYHGVAINICNNLNHFQNIVPCGIKKLGVTSLNKENINISMTEFDKILIDEFCKLFKVTIIE